MKEVKLVKRLLDVAETTHYPSEAEIALRHADRLMKRYGITRADLPVEEPGDPFVVGFRSGWNGKSSFILRNYA